MKKNIFFIISISLIFCSMNLANSQSFYQLKGKIQVPGDGGWDYISIDESNSRIFVSHSTQVQSIDIKTGKVDGTIPDTKAFTG